MTAPTSRGTVLIVDDDIDLGQFIADIARDDGFEAESISSPLEAIGRLEERAFDLVVTDVRMPGMDGVELIGRIKALSGQSESDELAEFRAALQSLSAALSV